ncbi:hypothetical protein [Candidatus Electronema sp. PJ]|uniref:hypothetical protein n=1 Tax=Candidatus Electronema sp. PJ TaxID=3401572 RepID=UPI003AA9D62A
MKANLAVSLSLAGAMFTLSFFASPVSASEVKIDDSILKIINEAVMKMQQKTMAENYDAMPLKDQMRGKMMVQNASKNYMQSIIQPQMMEKNMGAEKLKMMNQMSQF